MHSIASVRSASGAASYFASDNYYTLEGSSEMSVWAGEGATALGLDGTVTKEAFEGILNGVLPSGEDLPQSDNRRAGFDLTFSMPKSASVMAYVAGDMYGAAKRNGYMPDFAPAKPFPESGSVTVSPLLEHRRIRSRMKITTAEANAVVQLYEPETNRHLLSIYVAANDSIEVPVPSGTFRVRLIEGQTWHGPKLYFGSNTSYETVAQLMSFTAARGNGVDLHRTPNGNLPTRMMITNPEPI